MLQPDYRLQRIGVMYLVHIYVINLHILSLVNNVTEVDGKASLDVANSSDYFSLIYDSLKIVMAETNEYKCKSQLIPVTMCFIEQQVFLQYRSSIE